jgi:anhydro-N-acetylmuramic acid kinase
VNARPAVTTPVPEYYIGLMSGTSLDGVDGVLVDLAVTPLQVMQHVHHPFAPELADELLALNSPGPNELHRAALAANALVRAYAAVVTALQQAAGLQAS